MSVSRYQYAIKVYAGLEGLLQLKSDWLKLARANAGNYLHYPFWYESRLRVYADQNVVFCGVYQEGFLRAVLPFQKDHLPRLKIPYLKIYFPNEMGFVDVFSTMDLSEIKHKIFHAVKNELGYFAFVQLRHFHEGSGVMVSNLHNDQSMRKKSHDSNYMDFSNGVAVLLAQKSSKFRKDLAKKKRAIEAFGEMRFESSCGEVLSPEALQASLQEFMSVEDSSWKGAEGTSLAKQPHQQDFYKGLVTQYGEEGVFVAEHLYIDDICVASQIGLLVGDTLHLLKLAYNPEYSKYSPGKLIIKCSMDQAEASGCFDKISFITGLKWQDVWRPNKKNVYVSVVNSWGFGWLVEWMLKLKARFVEKKIQAAKA